VFHGALGYAVELGLLPVNPMGKVRWHAPGAAVALNPATVASPVQVRGILAQVWRVRPELAAFFGCCTTRRCARRKRSRCAGRISFFPRTGAGRSS
jgi:hypothetical protein